MSKVFFVGYFWLVTSTVAFIIAAITPFWILKSGPTIRGIFEACDEVAGSNGLNTCGYLLTPSSNALITSYRTGFNDSFIPNSHSLWLIFIIIDYAIACASLSIAAGALAIMQLWLAGIHSCLKTKRFESSRIRLRTIELLIAGTLFVGKY